MKVVYPHFPENEKHLPICRNNGIFIKKLFLRLEHLNAAILHSLVSTE